MAVLYWALLWTGHCVRNSTLSDALSEWPSVRSFMSNSMGTGLWPHSSLLMVKTRNGTQKPDLVLGHLTPFAKTWLQVKCTRIKKLVWVQFPLNQEQKQSGSLAHSRWPLSTLLDCNWKLTQHSGRDTCMLLFLEALVTAAKLWNLPRCPSVTECVGKRRRMHAKED